MAYAFLSLDVEIETYTGVGGNMVYNNFTTISNIGIAPFTVSTGVTFVDALTIQIAGNYMISWMCQPTNSGNTSFVPYNLSTSEYISGSSFSIVAHLSGDNVNQINGNIISNLSVGTMLNIFQNSQFPYSHEIKNIKLHLR